MTAVDATIFVSWMTSSIASGTNIEGLHVAYTYHNYSGKLLRGMNQWKQTLWRKLLVALYCVRILVLACLHHVYIIIIIFSTCGDIIMCSCTLICSVVIIRSMTGFFRIMSNSLSCGRDAWSD